MRSFCFEIIYGILLIVQKGHSTPDGQRVALNADCENYQPSDNYMEPPTCAINGCTLYEAPQSWCYVEEMGCSE